MYICLCRGVSESAIRVAVNNGARTYKQLSLTTGCGTQCGNCAMEVRVLLKECLQSKVSHQSTPLLEIFGTA